MQAAHATRRPPTQAAVLHVSASTASRAGRRAGASSCNWRLLGLLAIAMLCAAVIIFNTRRSRLRPRASSVWRGEEAAQEEVEAVEVPHHGLAAARVEEAEEGRTHALRVKKQQDAVHAAGEGEHARGDRHAVATAPVQVAAASPPVADSLVRRHLMIRTPTRDAQCSAAADVTFSSVLLLTVMTNLLESSRDPNKVYFMHCSVWRTLVAGGGKLAVFGDFTSRDIHRPYRDHIEKFWALEQWFNASIADAGGDPNDPNDGTPPLGLQDDSMLFFVDAFDVMLLSSLEEAVQCVQKAWCAGGWSRRDIFWLGERGLWPESWQYNAQTYPSHLYDDYNKINTGLYMAHWRTVREVARFAIWRSENSKDNINDQGLINDLYTNFPEWRARFHLDAQQACFATGHIDMGELQLIGSGPRWANTKRGTQPALLHAHGGGKAFVEPVMAGHPAGKMRYETDLKDPELLVYGSNEASSKMVKIRDMCAGGPGS